MSIFKCDVCEQVDVIANLGFDECKYCDVKICEHCCVKEIQFRNLDCCAFYICEYCGERKMMYDDENDKIYCKECYPDYTIEEIRWLTQEYKIYDLLSKYHIQCMEKIIISYLRVKKTRS